MLSLPCCLPACLHCWRRFCLFLLCPWAFWRRRFLWRRRRHFSRTMRRRLCLRQAEPSLDLLHSLLRLHLKKSDANKQMPIGRWQLADGVSYKCQCLIFFSFCHISLYQFHQSPRLNLFLLVFTISTCDALFVLVSSFLPSV